MKPSPTYRSAPIAWGKTPLLLPVLSFVVGVFLARRFAYPGGMAALMWGAAIVLVGVYLFRSRLPITPWPGLTLVAVLFVAAGGWRAAADYPPNASDFFVDALQEGDLLGGQVTSLRPGERNIRAQVQVEYLGSDSLQRASSGKVLLYLPPDIKTASVRVGDRVIVQGRVQALRGPLNPGVFDMRANWATQGIYHSIYLSDGHYWRHIPASGFSLRARAAAIRRAWFKSFQRYLTGDRLAVAAALVMGKKDLLTSEVRSEYAETGALHVLAVSGLHVGIIYLLISSLFSLLPLRKSRGGRVVETVCTVLAIWLFAFVSGLSPSVQRAATMFTIIALGKLGLGRSYILNTLCAAALLMLWVEPGQLFRVGFQLSFLALLGIVLFTPALERLVRPRNGFLRVLWSGVAASTGAQLGTMPVALYVFGQFSLLFFISGAAVVAFAFLSMGAGVVHGVVVGLGGYSQLSGLTGAVLSGIVYAQNAFIHFFSELPGVLVEVKHFPAVSAWCLGVGILCLAAWVHWRRVLAGVMALIFIGGSVVWALAQVQGKGQRAVSTVYHLPQKTLIDHYDGESAMAFGDSLEVGILDWQVLPNRKLLGYAATVRTRSIDSLTELKPGGVIWQVLDGQENRNYPDSIKAPYVLLRNKVRPRDVAPLWVAEGTVLIVDGSNPRYYFKEWHQLAAERRWQVWITGEDGAFVLRH